MAGAPTMRMMLHKNGKSFPVELLRVPLFNVLSSNASNETQFISYPRLQQENPVLTTQFNFLGDQCNAGVGVNNKNNNNNNNGLWNWRFGGFGDMGRVEAYGKRVVVDDDDDDDDKEEDFDEDEMDDEDFEDFDDEEDDDDDGDYYDEDEDDDVVKK